MWNNIERAIKDKIVHVIVEGIDGSGKSTLLTQAFNILHEEFPYRVLLIRNPSNQSLYNRMHFGDMTPYEIGMATLADFARVYNNAVEFLDGRGIILQDRSAITSGSIYNLSGMNIYESGIWHNAAENIIENTLGYPICFVMSKQLRQETNKFTGKGFYNDILDSGYDVMGTRYYRFETVEGEVKEDANRLVNQIDKELG